MPKQQTNFGGMVTDKDPNRLPSGTADDMLNVVLDNGELAKRPGFEEWEDDVDGSATGVKHLSVAHFADGTVYVNVKTAADALWHRKVSATAATSFTSMSKEQTHNANDRGFSFMWGDRWHYFDRGGGSRWHPSQNSAKAYKAGMPRCTVGATPAQAAGGEKDGWYRIYLAWRNNTTREEGMVAGPVATAVECRQEAVDNKSGLTVSNIATVMALDEADDYEITHLRGYSTNGNTEYNAKGGNARQIFPHVAYDDATVAKDAVSMGHNKADSVHNPRDRFTNAGGEPPGAQIGMYTGTRGIYGRVWISSALVPDKIKFSLPWYPTAVPKEHLFSQGGDAKTFEPIPWRGEIIGGMAGGASVMAYGGGIPAVFTPTSTYVMKTAEDGRLYPVLVHPSKGACADGCAVGTPRGVHAIGYRSWLVLDGGGINDIAQDRFSSTLDNIPVAQQGATCMAYYGYKSQVWAAVTKATKTVAQRILIWDTTIPGGGGLMQFDIACLAAGESITCMCELNHAGDEPSMLVGTDAGRIFKYPYASVLDKTTNYEAYWQGYFGQERVTQEQHFKLLQTHNGDNCADSVVVSITSLQTGGGKTTGGTTITPITHTLKKDFRVENIAAVLTHPKARLWRIKFSSTNSITTKWDIRDMTLILDKVKLST